jgi:hypothetical protein
MSTQKREIESILKKLPNKSRFRFFLLFVAISFAFWASTKLSKEYQLVQPFTLVWEEIPKGVVLNDKPSQIKVTLNASGVEILWYRLFKNKLSISLKDVDFTPEDRILNMEEHFFDIQQQLFGGTQLLQISPSLFPLQYSKMALKKLPVLTNLDINFRPGYLGEERLQITPDSVVVRGPKNMLDTLVHINTEEFKLLDVHENINQQIELERIEELVFEVESIQLFWPVLPYSEKSLIIPIKVVNIPVGVKVKLFPPEANLRATLPLSLLNAVQSSDFSLVVDYENIREGQADAMELKLKKHPPSVKKVIWEPLSVNYLIRR